METQIETDAERVLADEVQLEQILINLLRNAQEALRGHENATVVLTARRLPDEKVLICLRDFGPGLETEEMGSGLVISDLGRGEGLGVGLSLCRTLVEANGGTFRAYNAEGGGAVFCLELARSGEDCRRAPSTS